MGEKRPEKALVTERSSSAGVKNKETMRKPVQSIQKMYSDNYIKNGDSVPTSSYLPQKNYTIATVRDKILTSQLMKISPLAGAN